MAAKNARDTDGRANAPGKPRGVGGRDGAEFRGYINLDLSEAEKESFGRWVVTEAAGEMFDAALTDGVNVSVKRDPKTPGGFLASATMRREDSPNAGLVATARSREPQMALWRVIYILSLLYATGHWEDRQPVASGDRW